MAQLVPESVIGHEELVHQRLLALLVGHARGEVLRGALLNGADLVGKVPSASPRAGTSPTSTTEEAGGGNGKGGGARWSKGRLEECGAGEACTGGP